MKILLMKYQGKKKKIWKKKLSKRQLEKITNLTSTVYLNHLNVALYSLINKPLGYGLNNYEVAFKIYKESVKVKKFEGNSLYKVGKYFQFDTTIYNDFKKLNFNDGSSNLFKIIAEFGYLSFVSFFLIIYYSFSKKIHFEEKIFIIPIIITQLCRGAGYFNGGFMFCFIFMCYSIYKTNKST